MQFRINRYLGKWYEVARLDHSFEKGLIRVSAEYSLRDDGGVKVLNRGFDLLKNKWKEAEGKAYFTDDTNTGMLKVSFFGPFYGAYNIIDLDKDGYTYAMECGPDRSYLWILARKPDIDKKTVERLLQKSESFGFNTKKLIYVKHTDKFFIETGLFKLLTYFFVSFLTGMRDLLNLEYA